jgi:tetratricopeptide (TPR) repeat protein
VSENLQQTAAHSPNDKLEAQTDRAPSRSSRETRDQMRNNRLDAVKAEVADAAALRSKMIDAMRRKLENEARFQANQASDDPDASEAKESVEPAQHPPRAAKPLPAIYAVARPPQPPPKAYDIAGISAPSYPELRDRTETDPIFAPESTPAGVSRNEPRSQPRPLTGDNPEIWDEAFQSAHRVEKALARLTQALADEENHAYKAPKPGKPKVHRARRPRPLRVAVLFTTSFIISTSALIFAYDWHAGTSVEHRLAALVNQLLPGKTGAFASKEIPLPAVRSAEKPLAVRAIVRSPKTFATVKLEAFDAEGKADANIPLSIHAIATAPDQSVDIRLAGLPRGAELSAGRRQKDGSWLLLPGEQSGLTLQVPPEASGNLMVTVEALEQKSGELAAPPQEIRVKIAPAKMVVEPTATEITPVLNIPEAPAPLPPSKKDVEVPSSDTHIAAIEEAAEAPAIALGIDDPARPLMARGDALMELGDVASARSFYDRAFELGNIRAARSIARTYDPVVLASMKVQGLRADPGKALEWYRKAEEAGAPEASQDIAALETYLGH